MARLSDLIEIFIKQLIDDTDGSVEIQRNELASHFNCVPSQINYVIGTRFTNEKGYYVESFRGGGGHIQIKKFNAGPAMNYLMHVINCIGDSISQQSAEAFISNFIDYRAVTEREGLIMKAAVSDKVLGAIPVVMRDAVRAAMIKNILMGICSSGKDVDSI